MCVFWDKGMLYERILFWKLILKSRNEWVGRGHQVRGKAVKTVLMSYLFCSQFHWGLCTMHFRIVWALFPCNFPLFSLRKIQWKLFWLGSLSFQFSFFLASLFPTPYFIFFHFISSKLLWSQCFKIMVSILWRRIYKFRPLFC